MTGWPHIRSHIIVAVTTLAVAWSANTIWNYASIEANIQAMPQAMAGITERVTTLEGEVKVLGDDWEYLDKRVTQIDQTLVINVLNRLTALETNIENVDRRLDGIDKKMDRILDYIMEDDHG